MGPRGCQEGGTRGASGRQDRQGRSERRHADGGRSGRLPRSRGGKPREGNSKSAGRATPPRSTANGSPRAAKWPGAILSVVETLAGVFKSPEPISIDPRREDEEPSEHADEASATDGRFLPRQPDKRPSAPAGGRTQPVPGPPQPGADPDSGGDVKETAAELPHESRTSGEAAKTPPEPSREPPAPGGATETTPELQHQPSAPGHAEVTPPEIPHEAPTPDEAEEDPAHSSAADAPEPDPEAPPEAPAPARAPDAAPYRARAPRGPLRGSAEGTAH